MSKPEPKQPPRPPESLDPAPRDRSQPDQFFTTGERKRQAKRATTVLGLLVVGVVCLNLLLFLVFKKRGATRSNEPETSGPITLTNDLAAMLGPTQSVATAEPAAAAVPGSLTPQPAPLRVERINLNAIRPSAIISGRTVFVGDTLQGLRVTDIDAYRVTLIGLGVTNVLSLR